MRNLPLLTLLSLCCLLARAAEPLDTLPVLRLYGQFGYEYQPATLILGSDTLTARLKWRGGTTNTPDRHKRNYKIKLNEDHALLGMRSDNNWLLDAGQADVFRLRNRIATDLWNDFATPPYYHELQPKAHTGTRGRVIEVYLNDQYEGIYCLTEQIDRKQLKLRKADEQAIHGLLWKSKGYGASLMYDMPDTYDNYLPQWDVFEAKYPEPGDDLDSTDYRTLYQAINFVMHAPDDRFAREVSQYFDIPVVIDYYLFTNVLGAVDNRGKNMHWAVYDQQEDPRLTIAVWDLDGTVGQPWLANHDPSYTSPYYHVGPTNYLVERLIALDVDQFNQKAAERYKALRHAQFHTDSLKARYRAFYELLSLSGADLRETQRWSGDSDIDHRSIDFEQETEYICDWIEKHLSYLDTVFDAPIQSGIARRAAYAPSTTRYYDLQGRRLQNPQGLHIKVGTRRVASAP